MTIFENLEQIYNHLETKEQIELAERLLFKRKLEIIENQKYIAWDYSTPVANVNPRRSPQDIDL